MNKSFNKQIASIFLSFLFLIKINCIMLTANTSTKENQYNVIPFKHTNLKTLYSLFSSQKTQELNTHNKNIYTKKRIISKPNTLLKLPSSSLKLKLRTSKTKMANLETQVNAKSRLDKQNNNVIEKGKQNVSSTNENVIKAIPSAIKHIGVAYTKNNNIEENVSIKMHPENNNTSLVKDLINEEKPENNLEKKPIYKYTEKDFFENNLLKKNYVNRNLNNKFKNKVRNFQNKKNKDFGSFFILPENLYFNQNLFPLIEDNISERIKDENIIVANFKENYQNNNSTSEITFYQKNDIILKS